MILVVSSATAACSVALIEGDRTLDERHEVVGRGHAERLVPMIAELLGGHRPGSVLVDCGPGSFTGIRVGIAAARGLGISWGVPVAGLSSTALLAAGSIALQPGESVAIAMQGGHGELFVQVYARDPIRPLDALRSLTPPAAAAVVSAPLVVGSGAAALIAARGSGEAIDLLPRASDARLLPPALRNLAPAPIYGRAPDARPNLP